MYALLKDSRTALFIICTESLALPPVRGQPSTAKEMQIR
jgi:hypothetical protein